MLSEVPSADGSRFKTCGEGALTGMTLHVHMDACTLQTWGVQALPPDASLS